MTNCQRIETHRAWLSWYNRNNENNVHCNYILKLESLIKNTKRSLNSKIKKLKSILSTESMNHLETEYMKKANEYFSSTLNQIKSENTRELPAITHNTLTDQLTNLLILHKEIGFRDAWIGWHSYQNNVSYSLVKENIKSRQQINNHIHTLGVSLSKDQLNELNTECAKQKEEYKELIEQQIEREHRPTEIHLNEEAISILTDKIIPDDVKLNLSFGNKFLSPYECSDQNLHELLAQLEMTLDQAIPTSRIIESSKDIHQVVKNRKNKGHDNTTNWLRFTSERTKNFFEKNTDIFATKSDKGGHTVIINVSDYENKIVKLLDNDSYTTVNTNPLFTLIEREKRLIEFLQKNKKTQKFFHKTHDIHTGKFLNKPPRYEPNVLGLPKFYGLPKLNKKDIPLRPITATTGCVGYLLSKIFTRILGEIFPISKIHIKDSFEFAKFIDDTEIKETDILVSFDVVSMFTSIPFELVKEIIMNKKHFFERIYKIEPNTLNDIIDFTIRDCLYFTAINKTYKQINGLPMGSCASPLLARIVMDVIINNLLDKLPEITFIKVFVDDTIVAIDPNKVENALEVLNNFSPGQIKFTMEKELDQSINFLNVTLRRNGNKITKNWYRKPFYSGRLLNYYSSHKNSIIIGTAQHFIHTVLSLSDPTHFHENKDKVINTLRTNSFPETVIIALMHKNYSYMKMNKSRSPNINLTPQLNSDLEEDNRQRYVIFPHAICEGRQIKKILHKHKKPNIILADSTKNTKINSVTTRKTKTPTTKRSNLILVANCKCKKKTKVIKTNFNETGEMAMNRILTKNKECKASFHAYSKVKFMRGLHYNNQTRYLLKYIQWKHRKELDVIQQNYEFPNQSLCRLIETSKNNKNGSKKTKQGVQ